MILALIYMLPLVPRLCIILTPPAKFGGHTQARDEARVAMDTVEGFVCLNRKLMDELRRVV